MRCVYASHTTVCLRVFKAQIYSRAKYIYSNSYFGFTTFSKNEFRFFYFYSHFSPSFSLFRRQLLFLIDFWVHAILRRSRVNSLSSWRCKLHVNPINGFHVKQVYLAAIQKGPMQKHLSHWELSYRIQFPAWANILKCLIQMSARETSETML